MEQIAEKVLCIFNSCTLIDKFNAGKMLHGLVIVLEFDHNGCLLISFITQTSFGAEMVE